MSRQDVLPAPATAVNRTAACSGYCDTGQRQARAKNAPRLPRVLAIACAALLVDPGSAPGQCPPGTGDIRSIDPYGVGIRQIPDIASGGYAQLSESQLIDVAILGDGYFDTEKQDFFDDACEWYTELFSANGIFPYTPIAFAEAFRVRAIFEPSVERVTGSDGGRNSHYRVMAADSSMAGGETCVICGVNTVDGWWNNPGPANDDFRDRLFASIDALDPAPNLATYPSNLERPLPGFPSCYVEIPEQELMMPFADRYSNLVVIMLVKIDRCDGQGGSLPCGTVSGAAKLVCSNANCPSASRRVRVAFAERTQHEFNHAFVDLLDEYIQSHNTLASFTNPVDPSVFLLSNISFTNSRCDLLWSHLAPGGRYNPDPLSPIGRLYLGGYCELGAWHSEYTCLMNGKHKNYRCNRDENDDEYPLRVCDQLCFWCQEIVAVRILEKTGQLARAGDPSDINELGRVWYQLWDQSLRDAYYTRYDIQANITARNECYKASYGQPASCLVDCGNNALVLPNCLVGCDIVEYGNAIYVDSALGAPGNTGNRSQPLRTIQAGVQRAAALCGQDGLVAIKPGAYPGALTLNDPAILVPEACTPVVIGE